MQCSSSSVFTVCTTCNVISPMKYVLYFYSSTSCSMCAVPNMAVFCSSLILCFPGMLLRYCLSDYEIGPVASIITYYLSLLLAHSTCAEFLLWGLCCCCCFVLFCCLCHRPFLPGTSLEPTMIPTTQASSFRLQYFLHCVWCS